MEVLYYPYSAVDTVEAQLDNLPKLTWLAGMQITHFSAWPLRGTQEEADIDSIASATEGEIFLSIYI